MLHAVLFDLDNTLILFDENQFFGRYLQTISRAFRDLMPPEVFQKKLMTATRALVENNGKITNLNYFMNVFSAGYEDKREALWQRFRDFYATEFDQFQALVTVPDGVHDLFKQLRQMPLKMVVASHPLFPANIQRKRVEWAGLGEVNFALITDIENMTFCKPRLEYYREICDKINERPEDCLMVGNDPVNDIVAGKIGMKTYLVENPAEADNNLAVSEDLRRNANSDMPLPDFRGPLPEVINAVRALRNNI